MNQALRRTIWITRAEPGAAATAERVRQLGHRPLVAPLLEVRPTAQAAPDLADVGALAFTSANAARIFASLTERRDLPVFAVGAATAKAAKAEGFPRVLSADGDVEALAAGIVGRAGELRGLVLHAAAAEPAGDLAGALAKAGVRSRTETIYETAPLKPDARELEAAFAADDVLLHSPRAARQLAVLARGGRGAGLRALCLSCAVARPLARAQLKGLACAPFPMEAALLNLIDRDGPANAP